MKAYIDERAVKTLNQAAVMADSYNLTAHKACETFSQSVSACDFKCIANCLVNEIFYKPAYTYMCACAYLKLQVLIIANCTLSVELESITYISVSCSINR